MEKITLDITGMTCDHCAIPIERESFHPYLTLGEGIKLTAITSGKDLGKLSCCASKPRYEKKL